jgi:alpha-amylase/alpha-mannosidase (GH57 family)
MDRYICIHGHFYQPPRENPWLEEVELEDSAYPHHDWNERITAQCYAPNSASRILDPENRIVQIVNNYSKISFNFGPTLLSWLQRHDPETYSAILEADRLSQQLFSGHGSALAQVYNHMIMPLATRRDKTTQVLWAIQDFRKRFRRDPEGMWLPETAVDIETLEVLTDAGIRFTILAPRQAARIREIARRGKWHDVGNGRIDPSQAYQCLLRSGKAISLFFYDDPISRDIAFGGLLNSGEGFAQRLVGAFSNLRHWPQLIHIATDGETFGHHHRFGDRALAYCLHVIESQNLARLTNYGEYLEKHPPTHQVEISENSSWSCVHGVERWRNHCGCHSGMHPGWNQAWRKPLREAMDWLWDQAAAIFEERASQHLRSPWDARNDYIEVVLDRAPEIVEDFFCRHAVKEFSSEDKRALLTLLEMQRNAMLMYTSCGWFFDEVSGLETVKVMQYAAMVMQHAEKLQEKSLERKFLKRLEAVPSNIHDNARKVYELYVHPMKLDLMRVGVHYAVSSLFEDYSEETRIYCYRLQRELHRVYGSGRLRLAIGKTNLSSGLTWDNDTLSYAVLHLGDHNLNGAVRKFQGEDAFSFMENEIVAAFERGDVLEVIRLMDKHFGVNNFSIWHLFRDEQRKVVNQILELTCNDIEISYRRIYDNNYAIMSFLRDLDIPLSKPFAIVAEYIVNVDLRRLFEAEEVDLQRLEHLISAANRWQLAVDGDLLGFTAGEWIVNAMDSIRGLPEDAPFFEMITGVLGLLGRLTIDLYLRKAQDTYFSLGQTAYSGMKDKAATGDDSAQRWLTGFERLGPLLNVKFP